MSERKDERWLDSQLRQTVNGSTPAFDAESWKRRHRHEYEMLLARSEQSNPRRMRSVSGCWAAGLALAAAVILIAAIFLLQLPGSEPESLAVPTQTVASSPAGMMSMRSLRMAYDQGGFDGLDRQLQNTLDEFGPRSSSVSLQELF